MYYCKNGPESLLCWFLVMTCFRLSGRRRMFFITNSPDSTNRIAPKIQIVQETILRILIVLEKMSSFRFSRNFIKVTSALFTITYSNGSLSESRNFQHLSHFKGLLTIHWSFSFDIYSLLSLREMLCTLHENDLFKVL